MPPRYPSAYSNLFGCSSVCYRLSKISPIGGFRSSSKRTLIAPPRENSGPLMSRRADRALPEIIPSYRIWLKTAPIFVVVITISALGIFNYQKTSSSVVAAALYALRTSEIGRKELGDEIYFRDMWPWIWGELNQLHGRVNIGFGVKGTKSSGYMRFRSERKKRTRYVSFLHPSTLTPWWSNY